MGERFSEGMDEMINSTAHKLASKGNEELIMQALAEILGYFVERGHKEGIGTPEGNAMLAAVSRALRIKLKKGEGEETLGGVG